MVVENYEITPTLTLPRWVNSATEKPFDCAINGVPFNKVVTEDLLYQRATASDGSNQIQRTSSPGEQQLGPYWYRSQSSFNDGAGIEFLDTGDITPLQYRYWDSEGVDSITVPGRVTLLNETSEVEHVVAVGPKNIIGYSVAGEDGVLFSSGATVKRVPANGASVSMSGFSGTVEGLTTNGTAAIALTNNGVYAANLPGSSAIKMYPISGLSNGEVAWAKDRVIAAVNNILYELPMVGTETALPTAFYTHPIDGWRWTGISDSPSGIILTGYSGDRGAVYIVTLNESGQLNPPFLIAELPRGEVPLSMICYMGTYIIIGTTRGVRVGLISPADMAIQLGSLSIETQEPVYSLYARDTFVWTGGVKSNGLNGGTKNPGVYKINLATITNADTLQFAYQKDLFAPINSGYVEGICNIGFLNKIAFITNLGNVYFQKDTYVTQGFLETSKIKMNTSELKVFQFAKVLNSATGINDNTRIQVYWRNDGGVLSAEPLTDYDAGEIKEVNFMASDFTPQNHISYRFVFKSTPVTKAQTTVFNGYQVKSLPTQVKQINIQLAGLMYEYITLLNGERVHIKTADTIKQLEALVSQNTAVIWQDFNINETRLVQIENFSFSQNVLSENIFDRSKPQGVMILTLRTVDQEII